MRGGFQLLHQVPRHDDAAIGANRAVHSGLGIRHLLGSSRHGDVGFVAPLLLIMSGFECYSMMTTRAGSSEV
jgi:hypothetical protein